MAQEQVSATGTLTCDVKFAPFSSSKRRRERDSALIEEERAASIELERALRPYVVLTQYPKSLIEVFVMVLQADGGVGAAVLTAAALGLVDAGIEMSDVPVTMSVAGVASEAGGSAPLPARLTVDPDEAAEAGATFLTTVGISRAGLVTSSDHCGEASSADLLRALALAIDGGYTLLREMRGALVAAAPKPQAQPLQPFVAASALESTIAAPAEPP